MRKILVIRRRGKLKMKSRSVLQLQHKRGEKTIIREYPVRDLDSVLVIGSNVYIDSGAISVLATLNIPIASIAKDSIGILYNPIVILNSNYRMLQYSIEKTRALDIAKSYIESKVLGMRNILQYYNVHPPTLPEPPTTVEDPETYEYRIRLWESQTSNKLWNKIITLIDRPTLEELRNRYAFAGRRPRHPDPFNKTLSVMYAALYSLATKALIAAGLDPTYGFLHRTRYSTPLTFDYTEMLKPIAIQATIDLVNTEGLPTLAEDGELDRNSVNNAIKWLYKYLTMKHQKTKKTPYQYIFLKAYCLAKHLEGKCRKDRLTTIWDRRRYK
jgi:CRISPR-associated protein Cas1